VNITSYGEGNPTRKMSIWPDWVGEQRQPGEYSAAYRDKLARLAQMTPLERDRYDREQRAWASQRDAKKKLSDIAEACGLRHFLSFTYSHAMPFTADNCRLVQRDMNQFIKRIDEQYPGTELVLCADLSERGKLHFHGTCHYLPVRILRKCWADIPQEYYAKEISRYRRARPGKPYEGNVSIVSKEKYEAMGGKSQPARMVTYMAKSLHRLAQYRQRNNNKLRCSYAISPAAKATAKERVKRETYIINTKAMDEQLGRGDGVIRVHDEHTKRLLARLGPSSVFY
jgi:hypothetical protein